MTISRFGFREHSTLLESQVPHSPFCLWSNEGMDSQYIHDKTDSLSAVSCFTSLEKSILARHLAYTCLWDRRSMHV